MEFELSAEQREIQALARDVAAAEIDERIGGKDERAELTFITITRGESAGEFECSQVCNTVWRGGTLDEHFTPDLNTGCFQPASQELVTRNPTITRSPIWRRNVTPE